MSTNCLAWPWSLTNAQGAEKEMTISAIHGGETYVDILKNNEAKVCL